jgi:hypothetical protein
MRPSIVLAGRDDPLGRQGMREMQYFSSGGGELTTPDNLS